MRRNFRTYWLGRVSFSTALAAQERLVFARQRGLAQDSILLLEHDAIITLGRTANPAHVLIPERDRVCKGVDLRSTGRGGEVTYHGPGQLVAYPILDLKPDRCDVRAYVHDLIAVMVRTVGAYGIAAGSYSRHLSAWVDLDAPTTWAGAAPPVRPARIGAVGIRISRWVTMHGFALNVDVEPDAFKMIVACGIVDQPVTTMSALVRAPSVAEAARTAERAFGEVFDAEVVRGEPAEILPAEALSTEERTAWT